MQELSGLERTRFVYRQPDEQHPGRLLKKTSYVADADREWTKAHDPRPAEYIFVDPESLAEKARISLDLSKFTPEQRKQAAQAAMQATQYSDTPSAQIVRANIAVQKLVEMQQQMQSNPNYNFQGGYPPPGPPPSPQPSYQPPTPMGVPAGNAYNAPPGPPQPSYQPPSPPQPPPAPPSVAQFPPPYQGMTSPPVSATAGPPRQRVRFRVGELGEFTVPYHQVTVQRDPQGTPLAVYLTLDNRFDGASKYMAEQLSDGYVLVPDESAWYQVAGTGLVFDLVNPERGLDLSTAVLFVAGIHPAGA